MYMHVIMRASIGLVGFCLVAFVQQPARASGSKASQGKFSRQNTLIPACLITLTLEEFLIILLNI